MPPDYRPSYLAAAVASTAVLVLYVLTLAPSTAMWDAGEYMAAAHVMGVAHPPGNPLFILVGRAFSVLPIAPTAAHRINILAAFCSAAAAGFWFLVAERVVAAWLRERWQRLVIASIAAITGATAFTVWNQSVVNEKVYTITLLGIAAISWIALRWLDEGDVRKRDRLLLLAAYLLVLGYTNHMGGLLAAPALALLVLIERPRALLRWRLLLAGAAVAAIGFSPYATQIVRASFQPPINMGATSACPGTPEVSCVLSAETSEAFRTHLSREQYGKPSLLDRQAPMSAQLGMYWLYFKWQWVRDAAMQRPVAQNMAALLFLALGLLGGWLHFKSDRRTFWYFGTLVGTLGVGLVFYMNFRLGWTQALLRGLDVYAGQVSEVRDRDYFFLWSFSSWGVWVALGLAGCWQWLAARVRPATVAQDARGQRFAWAMASPVLLIALLPLVANWNTATRQGETFTAEWGRDVLRTVGPYGVLFTFGDNDSYPLWYAQQVEGVRPDVRTAVTGLLGTSWYATTILHQPQREYRAERGSELFAAPQAAPPPILRMSPREAQEMDLYSILPQAGRFEHAGLEGVIQPGLLTKDQVLVLSVIRDSFPARPIYFTGPGDYLQRLGLDRYLVREGLLYRLNTPEELSRDGVVEIAGVERIDVDRTLAFWNDVYTAPEAAMAQGRWVDQPSISIPYAYVRTGYVLAVALEARGQAEESRRVLERADRLARSVGMAQ